MLKKINSTIAKLRRQMPDVLKDKPKSDRAFPRVQFDIESVKVLREASERYLSIVDTAVDAIIVAGHLGQVRSFNRAAEMIFGYAAKEVVDRNINLLMPEALQPRREVPPRGQKSTDERGVPGVGREMVGVRKDGSTVPLELSTAQWKDVGGQNCFTLIMRDVTQRNKQAQALQVATEVAQQARVDAESANRAKTEFLAVMSHEIRTPLTSISGFVDLLTRAGGLTPPQRRYIELVKTANAALLTIVNDILDFSKVEAGQLDLEPRPFSLSALIHDTVAIVHHVASAKGLRLDHFVDAAVPDWLAGDHARLRQVLLNLLNNAIKFTDHGSICVEARSHISEDGQERVHFSITDTGIGIPAEQQHRLFKRFSQADSSVSRRHGGTGLGLAICKRLVELMHGDIGVHSEIDRGSTFWFTACLPTAKRPEPKSKPSTTAEGAKRRDAARILVVDDIETNLEIVEAYLEDYGYFVDTVSSATEAIELLNGERYDLILMDIQMPVMDGVTATRRIRALPAPVSDIPIVAMTGNVMPQQIVGFLAAGMNDHVGKPIERAKLYEKVRRWMPKPGSVEISAVRGSAHFDQTRFDELVTLLGAARVEVTAAGFLSQLTQAFKSTTTDSRREAHSLINCAGLMGFPRLVEVCQDIENMSPDDEYRQRMTLSKSVRVQSMAQHRILNQLLPSLRGMLVRPAG